MREQRSLARGELTISRARVRGRSAEAHRVSQLITIVGAGMRN
jgi:hypothetical protein